MKNRHQLGAATLTATGRHLLLALSPSLIAGLLAAAVASASTGCSSPEPTPEPAPPPARPSFADLMESKVDWLDEQSRVFRALLAEFRAEPPAEFSEAEKTRYKSEHEIVSNMASANSAIIGICLLYTSPSPRDPE